MPNVYLQYFNKYSNSNSNFSVFHNQIINMPRAKFSQIGDIIRLLKSLASYILLIDMNIISKTLNYKIVYEYIVNNYKNGILPSTDRNIDFENEFLNINVSVDKAYEEKGRLFRHYMEYFAFFGIVKNGVNKQSKIFDIDSLEELVLTPNNILFDVFRNKILNINIKDNDFIKSMQGINITSECDYRPARAIILYCKEMNRQVTAFEVSILLGRIDETQKEKDILHRAITIGKILPNNFEDQKKQFFGSLGWKRNGVLFQYASSQSPDFKFKVFLLLMKTFKLIDYDERTNLISLTEYSKELVRQDISFEILDLEKLLAMIDNDSEDSNKLSDIIIRKRTSYITKAIQDDGMLVEKLNKRNIRNPIIKNGRRMRNKLIAEVAKIKANYLDEVNLKPTFEGKNGYNYVEAHHIIEFNGENGPDITDNLVCLGPENHSLIHHGSSSAVEDFYRTCQSRGVLTFNRFKNICVKYKCLTKDHVQILLHKKIISKTDANELDNLIDVNGIDPLFINSLSVPADNK